MEPGLHVIVKIDGGIVRTSPPRRSGTPRESSVLALCFS